MGEVVFGNISDSDWIEKEHIFDEGEYRIIQTGNLGNGEYLNKPNNAKYFHQANFDELKANEIFPNDILISRLAAPAGRTIILPDVGSRMVTAVDVTVVRPNDNFNSYFFMTTMNSQKILDEVGKEVTGTTHKRISRKNLENITLSTTSLPEQTAIGSFFHTLDDIITASQRKVAGLKQLKAAYLQQMFPQAGERVPRVRFSEFTGDWNEVKVGEIAETYSGGTPSVGIKSYYNGAIPFIRSAEINSDKTELYLSNDGLKNSSAKMVNVGTILYALYGATSGEVGRSKIAGAINQAILAIEPKDNYNFEFIAQWLRRQKESIVSTYLQGGQGNLSAAIIKELHISAPLLAEQTAIGNFFCNLDTQIAAKSEKLEKLKQIKAAYLQKMFI